MKKSVWILSLSTFAMGSQVFAADVNCPLTPISDFERASATISNFNFTQTITNTTNVGGLTSCDDQMAARSNFKVTDGSSNLTGSGSGSYPFGVDAKVEINNSTASSEAQNLAKIWLSENLKISFNLRDDARTTPVAVKALNTDYNVHPETSQPGRVTINGEEYLKAGNGLRNARFTVPNTGVALINKTTPSNSVIDALSGATVRIHLGTLTYKYINYPVVSGTADPNVATTELYLNLKLNFSPLTCTMSNQTVNLATVPASILNSSQTANQQNFNISFSCIRTMPNKELRATITDSYTPDNINSNGILKNQPTLANKSNVDVQLMDDTNKPLTIGTQSSFYKVPAGSNATTFSKTLKARYYRSEAVAKPGYVQAQATVFFDYQ
ncbi:fimbrial protein [Acinetobacter sp. I-MWF]|uniref:fimbrial protein n=1 Tax=Acinetobacter sp. I-MWF TaxID=2940517 RepID=UPI0021C7752A|nr:fimbrial protein [Acinetobacter sp. I-MWF]MCT9977881.1 fimbrial protein [Acinetobacter sp. I-MWF]